MLYEPGAKIADRYEIVRPLGKGAFGSTFLARDLVRERQVAVKVLDPARATDWKAFELFARESDVLLSLRHRGVPEVYESFRDESSGTAVQCLVMEYVEGESLAATIESGRRLDRTGVMHLFTELVGVLDYLHSRVPPILHRDIKPANIIIRPDGTATLVDFGSVRAVHRPDAGSTVAGTYGYMPYEQYMGHASPASDLYGLGATFLHLVTGLAPPQFMTDEGRLEVPAALPCGEPLAGILVRLLKPSPNERFQSAREVREAIFSPVVPTAGRALLPHAAAPMTFATRVPVNLPDGPRRLAGETRELYRKVAPGTWRMLNASAKTSGRPDLGSVLLIGAFSLLTAGILPLWFFSIAQSRKRRVRPFMERGILTEAVILSMEIEDIGFDEKVTRVRYEFEVGGRMIRASDTSLRSVAERWQPGERVEILYLPDQDDDSIIVSTA